MIEKLKAYSDFRGDRLALAGADSVALEPRSNRALVRRRKRLVGRNHHRYRLLSLTKQGIIVRDVASGKGKFSSDMGTSQEVRDGDLVFCFFDVPETPRTVGLSPHHGMITGAYTVLEPLRPGVAPYLELFYRAMDDSKLLSPLYSGLRNTIPVDRFLGTKTPLPPPEEQEAIVRFLDHANRRIDHFIRSKKRLIALLSEQKQAIIHRAVTRGLDASVELKDSGVPWFGEIPAHWETVPLKRIARFKGGAGFPIEHQGRSDKSLPFIKVSDMTLPGNERFMVRSNNSVSRETARSLGAFVFPKDSIIFPKVGGAMLTNKRRVLSKPSCIDNNMMGCVVSRGHIPYVFLLLEQLDFGRLSKPGPVPAIGEGEVREVKVAVPPEEEQVRLAGFVESETASTARVSSRTS
jgi:restriction endonuclease S subunit